MKKFLETLTPRNTFLLMVCIGLVQVAAYYLAGMTVRADGEMALAQPDTLLYCQAARRIVEGGAFSFSVGELPSTGTTSVLYPFVLALPYGIGFRGGALLTAGFVLNAVFYLCFLVGWGLFFAEKFAGRPFPRVVASVLLACFGPAAYCALAQSDIGIWMALSAFLAWGFASGKCAVYIPLLVLGPWFRPEGMIVVAAYCAVLALRPMVRVRNPSGGEPGGDMADWIGAILGVCSVLGVFFFNYALTGHGQFASVAHKGYFTQLPFCQAVAATAADALALAKAYLLGLPSGMPRVIMFVPVLGALTMWIGLLGRDWRRSFDWREGVWYLVLAGGFWTVSTSGWQDRNLDRYLAWQWPVMLFFVAEGLDVIDRRLRQLSVSVALAAVHGVFTMAMALVFACLFHSWSDRADRFRAFARRCDKAMEPQAALGLWSKAGGAYELSSRRVVHLGGIYTPALFTWTSAAALEVLKYDHSIRFPYYLYDCSEDPAVWGGAEKVVLGEQLLVGPDGFELRRVDWRALDAASATPRPPRAGLELCDRVDVGHEGDERSHAYELLPNYHMPDFRPFTQVGKLNGVTAVEGGRLVCGGDEMTVHVDPGKDLHVVMRTSARQKVSYARNLESGEFDLAFDEALELDLAVDGRPVTHAVLKISAEGFSEVSMMIPASALASSEVRISFLGDHIACGYWFYQ